MTHETVVGLPSLAPQEVEMMVLPFSLLMPPSRLRLQAGVDEVDVDRSEVLLGLSVVDGLFVGLSVGLGLCGLPLSLGGSWGFGGCLGVTGVFGTLGLILP